MFGSTFLKGFQPPKPLEKYWSTWQVYPKGFQSNAGLEKVKNSILIGTSFRFLAFDQILNFFFSKLP